MKQIQVIVTLEVTNDQYSELLNESTDIETLVHHALEYTSTQVSFDFPAVLIPRLNK